MPFVVQGNYIRKKEDEPHRCFGYQRLVHYDIMPMQYTAIFHGCKIDNIQKKNYYVFLIFAQNIERVYTSTNDLCYTAKI